MFVTIVYRLLLLKYATHDFVLLCWCPLYRISQIVGDGILYLSCLLIYVTSLIAFCWTICVMFSIAMSMLSSSGSVSNIFPVQDLNRYSINNYHYNFFDI